MWRTSAVVAMLVEEIAGLRFVAEADPPPSEQPSEYPETLPLNKARRRARLMIALDWTAIIVLFTLRDRTNSFLPWEPAVETIFTIGVLSVAAHSGLRWAQLNLYRAVERLCTELRERHEN